MIGFWERVGQDWDSWVLLSQAHPLVSILFLFAIFSLPAVRLVMSLIMETLVFIISMIGLGFVSIFMLIVAFKERDHGKGRNS